MTAAPTTPATTSTTRRLRAGLLVIAGLTAAGTAAELVLQHHWTEPVQWFAWLALVLVLLGIVLVARDPSARTARWVRVIAGVVVVLTAVGILEHVLGNHSAGPLDGTWGEQWDTLSPARQWWMAFSQQVGPSPALAPGVLTQGALCLWMATIGLTGDPGGEPGEDRSDDDERREPVRPVG